MGFPVFILILPAGGDLATPCEDPERETQGAGVVGSPLPPRAFHFQ